MALYGRNRESVLDIEQEMYQLFIENPNHWIDEERNIPLVSLSEIPSILRNWADSHGSGDLLSEDELEQFLSALRNIGDSAEPGMILPLIAVRGKGTPASMEGSESASDAQNHHSDSPSRSSSPESYGKPQRSASIPDAPESPFDAKNRQRSRPLAAPSSWASKPQPAAKRRKSDAGSSRAWSDSESSPTVSRQGGRSRAPSNPTSPSADTSTAFSPNRSPYSSRPPSRSNSRNGFYGHQSEVSSPISLSPMLSDHRQANPVQSHGHMDSDEEDEYEQTTRFSRLSTASTASLAPEDRVDGLTRANEELARKLMDAEQSLTRRMSEHDEELMGMESKLEEMRQELAAKNREEKELRSKDRTSTTQISALETEVSRLQRALESSRTAYQALHKQYQEQCVESEKYRNSLRTKDEEINQLNHLLERSSNEEEKKDLSYKASEARILQLEQELISMREAEGNLDLQKAENLMLKETIDRLRFELDEATNAAASGNGLSTGPPSHAGTVSKSLGAEMARSMQGHFIAGEESFDEGLERGDSGEETEAEEEIQTIITRKRKVAGRANKSESFVHETIKEYSDAWSQYDAKSFVTSSSVQTEATERNTSFVSAGQTAVTDGLSLLADSSTIVEDLPPSYATFGAGEDKFDQDLQYKQIALETLKRWHKCEHSSLDVIPRGVSQDALEDWEELKKEIGIDCLVINKALEGSQRTPPTRRRKAGSRFYKIYNTYIFGDNGFPAPSIFTVIGIVAVAILVQPFFPSTFNNLGPVYQDRLAWTSANTVQATGDGFDDSQAHALVGLLSRVVLGGAQIAAGRLRPAMIPT